MYMRRQILLSCPPLCLPYLYNLTSYSFIASKPCFHQGESPSTLPVTTATRIYRPHTMKSDTYPVCCAVLLSTSGCYKKASCHCHIEKWNQQGSCKPYNKRYYLYNVMLQQRMLVSLFGTFWEQNEASNTWKFPN